MSLDLIAKLIHRLSQNEDRTWFEICLVSIKSPSEREVRSYTDLLEAQTAYERFLAMGTYYVFFHACHSERVALRFTAKIGG